MGFLRGAVHHLARIEAHCVLPGFLGVFSQAFRGDERLSGKQLSE
jgi:hypothetical protein